MSTPASTPVRLVLPLPPSTNDAHAHPMETHRKKRAYQAEAWITACRQRKPSLSPPAKAVVRSTLYVRNYRDEDNAMGGLKWLLDALRQKQRGSLRWRSGWAEDCGFFVDDDPARLTVEKPEQVIERKEPRVEVSIEEVGT